MVLASVAIGGDDADSGLCWGLEGAIEVLSRLILLVQDLVAITSCTVATATTAAHKPSVP